MNKYNKNKILNIYNKNNLNEINAENEINNLQKSILPQFNQYLIEINIYIKSLFTPNLNEYKNWNINKMIKWISLLENGRYIKYLDILKKGFLNDGIDSGECLPDITKNDLRAAPFNIENFKDRRDLEKHFKSLQKYDNQQNELNILNDKEGGFTEYH